MWWVGMCDKPLPEGTRLAHAQLCIARGHYMCLSCLTKTRQLHAHTMMCRAGDTQNPAISREHHSEWGRCASIEYSNHLDTFIWVVCGVAVNLRTVTKNASFVYKRLDNMLKNTLTIRSSLITTIRCRRLFTLIMNTIFMWALRIMRQTVTCTIWIQWLACTNCVFHVLREAGVKRKVSHFNTLIIVNIRHWHTCIPLRSRSRRTDATGSVEPMLKTSPG